MPAVKTAAPASFTAPICCGMWVEPATITGFDTAAQTACINAGTHSFERYASCWSSPSTLWRAVIAFALCTISIVSSRTLGGL